MQRKFLVLKYCKTLICTGQKSFRIERAKSNGKHKQSREAIRRLSCVSGRKSMEKNADHTAKIQNVRNKIMRTLFNLEITALIAEVKTKLF